MPPTITICEHSIYPGLLPANPVVVDCGANVGAFSAEVIDRFGCICYAFEPSPVTFPQIPDRAGLIKVNVALCGEDRTVRLNVCESSQSTSLTRLPYQTYLETVDVPGRRLEPLLAELGVTRVDLLKVDVEGAEIDLLDSCSDDFLRGIGQITIEFHKILPSVPVAEIERVLARLKGLEFRELRGTRGINHHDVLLVNGARLSYVKFLGSLLSLRARWAAFRIGQMLGNIGRVSAAHAESSR